MKVPKNIMASIKKLATIYDTAGNVSDANIDKMSDKIIKTTDASYDAATLRAISQALHKRSGRTVGVTVAQKLLLLGVAKAAEYLAMQREGNKHTVGKMKLAPKEVTTPLTEQYKIKSIPRAQTKTESIVEKVKNMNISAKDGIGKK